MAIVIIRGTSKYNRQLVIFYVCSMIVFVVKFGSFYCTKIKCFILAMRIAILCRRCASVGEEPLLSMKCIVNCEADSSHDDHQSVYIIMEGEGRNCISICIGW